MTVRTILALALAALLAGCASGPGPVRPTADDLERLHAAEAEALETARTGQGVNWTNPATGHRGSVTVLETDTSGARPCRTVQRVFTAGDTTRTGRALACRGADGSWEIVRETPLRTPAEEARARDRHYRMYYGIGGHWGPYYDPRRPYRAWPHRPYSWRTDPRHDPFW